VIKIFGEDSPSEHPKPYAETIWKLSPNELFSQVWAFSPTTDNK